jgi:hypothetical protein
MSKTKQSSFDRRLIAFEGEYVVGPVGDHLVGDLDPISRGTASQRRSHARGHRDHRRDGHVLALKGNQGSLREDVEIFAAEQKTNGFKDTKISRDQTIDGDHGRIETRTACSMT